jgi:peptidyl-prolyl cis-trans isomerase A (cyclophilin A)
MIRTLVLGLSLLAAAPAFAKPAKPLTPEQAQADIDKGKALYGTLDTTLGTIVVKFYTKEAPKTVSNFVELAMGGKDWKDLKTGEMKKGVPFYDGLLFHRVIPSFMIQGGDQLGTGTGNPGYMIPDENQVPIDRAGLVAMANAGPNTSGSQFYITETPQARLRTYNLFAEVVKGQEVVNAIGNTPTQPGDRPVTDVVIKKLTISETAPKR